MSRISMPLIALAALSVMAQTPKPAIEIVQGPELRIVYRGFKGFDGLAGSAGSRGMSGSFGSLDPHRPRPGGQGATGGRGHDGAPGQAGGVGPDLSVVVSFLDQGGPRLLVMVEARGETRRLLLDPARTTLTLCSEGGRGGWGGRGGPGGPGGPGGMGSPSGMRGADGLRGLDGLNGPAGRGGAINVSVEPKARPYLAAIHFESRGGPEPVIHDVATARP